MPFNRLKMRDVSRELFIEHGWDVPRGLINAQERNPLNYTLEQYQQAKRAGLRASAAVGHLVGTDKGFEVLPRRWVVERTFGWLGRSRRLAKDWETHLESAIAWLFIAHIRIATRRLARA